MWQISCLLEKKKTQKPAARPEKHKKLTYKEKLLLKSLPEKIAKLESEQEELQRQINGPDFFKRPLEETRSVTNRLEILEAELLKIYAQWEELDTRS